MKDHVKKFALVVPKPGMPREVFQNYWRETHGPLVASSPGYADWRLRYVQNRVLGAGPIGTPFGFAGMAEFWLPGTSPNEDAFSSAPIYQERIRVDEQNFIDLDRTVSLGAFEHVLIPGSGNAKLVVLSSMGAGLSRSDFKTSYLAGHKATLRNTSFAQRIRGWIVNHTIEGSFRLPGGRAAEPLPVDFIEELWFDTSDDLKAAVFAAAATDTAWSNEGNLFGNRQSFVAEETVFFDVMKSEIGRGE